MVNRKWLMENRKWLMENGTLQQLNLERGAIEQYNK